MNRAGVMLLVAAGLAVDPAAVGGAGGPADQRAPWTISGRVLDADTGQPVAGAHVRAGTGEPVRTDGAGAYTLSGLPPGPITVGVWGLSAHKVTSLAIPRTVTVPPSGSVPGIDFRVRLEGNVSGRVADDDNRPVAGVVVMAVTREYRRSGQYGGAHEFANQLWHFRKATATTDDEGRYTLEGLWAGRPHWILAYRPLQYDRPTSAAPGEAAARAPVLAATYHPAADALEAATPVVIASLERREGVDIIMRRASSICVDVVTTSDGTPAPLSLSLEDEDVARLVLSATTTRPAWRFSGRSGAEGQARLCGLYPGRFRLVAAEALSERSEGRRGQTTFTVGGDDLDGVRVDAVRPVHVTGLIDFEGEVLPPGAAPTVSVSLMPRTGGSPPSRASVPGPFMVNLAAGVEYSVSVWSLAPPMYVRDVSFNGESILHAPLAADASSGPGRMRIVLGDDGGTIVATVSPRPDPHGEPTVVLALPADATRAIELSTNLRAAVADEFGVATFDALPPGPYSVLAVTDVPPAVLQYPGGRLLIDRTPDTLDQLLSLRSRGEHVDVSPGARVTVFVR